jgi:phosphoglycerate dehydrogenase-like enzyme
MSAATADDTHGPGGAAVAVEGAASHERQERFAAAVRAGGGRVTELADADGLVWLGRAADLGTVIEAAPRLRWIQLQAAGVEAYLPVLGCDVRFTSAKGAFAGPVAEHALGLILASMREIVRFGRRTTWTSPSGRNLIGARVVVVGAGGIGRSLVALLEPFRCQVTVVGNGRGTVPGAATLGPDALRAACADALVVVLALALTPATVGIVDAELLAAMRSDAHLVNVARGRHVVTDDLVVALRDRVIAGAALDVTDPEPLPDGHPLWTMDNCIITPHTADTPEMADPLLAERVRINTAHFVRSEPLEGLVDPARGY